MAVEYELHKQTRGKCDARNPESCSCPWIRPEGPQKPLKNWMTISRPCGYHEAGRAAKASKEAPVSPPLFSILLPPFPPFPLPFPRSIPSSS